VILLFLFSCVSRNLFGAQFSKLENVYKITQKTLTRRSSISINCIFRSRFIIY